MFSRKSWATITAHPGCDNSPVYTAKRETINYTSKLSEDVLAFQPFRPTKRRLRLDPRWEDCTQVSFRPIRVLRAHRNDRAVSPLVPTTERIGHWTPSSSSMRLYAMLEHHRANVQMNPTRPAKQTGLNFFDAYRHSRGVIVNKTAGLIELV